ncbi:MAG: hypothetical protein HY235_10420 [Acidobacteria bacterium]|nr:hypothetical protein [Acidobacteriota bacterium]
MKILRSRNGGILASAVTLLFSPSALGASWEPFTAKIRRETRTVDSSGRTVTKVSFHTYMRATNGSLRHEVWGAAEGSVLPESVSLSDVETRRTYHLDVRRKIASYASGFQDPEEQYTSSLGGASKANQEFLGVPCSMITSVFHENGKVVSRGKSCRAIGYGIVIQERATVPTGNGKVMYWETDLVEFQRNSEPPAELMRVPSGYQVVETTRPNFPCTNCVR